MVPSLEPIFDFYTVILLAGIVPGFLLSTLILRQAQNHSANLWLGLLALLLTLNLLEVFLNHSRLIVDVMGLYNFSEPLQFLLGPVLYLFQRAIVNRFPQKTFWLHLIPFAFFFCYLFFEYTGSAEQKYNNYLAAYQIPMRLIPVERWQDPDPWNIRPFATTFFIGSQLLIYVLLSAWGYRKHWMAKSQKARSIWIRQFLVICSLGAVVFLVVKTLTPSTDGENIIGAYLVFLIYSLGYFALQGSSLFDRENKKYSTSALPDELAAQKARALRALMSEQKPYLRSDLSLEDLAAMMKLSPHYLSQIINERLETNFFGLVNQYRIAEAKRCLSDASYDHLKIEEIGYQVGYNSKSAFFTAFKKVLNTTPQAFRKSLRQKS